jgi:hypothetical protein
MLRVAEDAGSEWYGLDVLDGMFEHNHSVRWCAPAGRATAPAGAHSVGRCTGNSRMTLWRARLLVDMIPAYASTSSAELSGTAPPPNQARGGPP